MRGISRKSVVFCTTSAAAVLLLTSAAFGCGTWRGKFTVTGNGGSGQSVTVGSQNNMTSCSMSRGAQMKGLPDVGQITVKVEPTDTNCVSGVPSPNKLPPNTYTINFLSDVEASALFFDDCMNAAVTGGGGPTSGVGNPVGTIQVDNSGYSLDANGNHPPGAGGERTYTVPSLDDTPAVGSSLVCISDAFGHNSNLAPIEVL